MSLKDYSAMFVTGMMERFMKSLPEKSALEKSMMIMERLDQIVKEYKRERRKSKLGVISGLLHQMDEYIKTDINELREQITCKKGCDFCCKIQVDICEDETLLLLHAAKEKKIAIDWDYVKVQSEMKDASEHARSDHAACPFLKDRKCSVYKFRPAACRKYFVVSDPQICDASIRTDLRTSVYFDLPTEMGASALMNTGQERSPMAVMLLKYKPDEKT